MATINIGGQGLVFSPTGQHLIGGNTSFSSVTLDAAGESVTLIGRLSISDRAINKQALGGTFYFRSSTSTFANAASNIRIGLQDVTGATGIETGTFDVYKDFTGGGGVFVSNAWQGHVLDTGSKLVSHGDLIAFSIELTARGGVDSVVIGLSDSSLNPPTFKGIPYKTTDSGAGPAKASSSLPMSGLILFSDGEVGFIDFSYPFQELKGAFASTTLQLGLQFVAPLSGNISAITAGIMQSIGATDVLEINIWEDPTGTPVSIYSQSIDGDLFSGSTTTISQSFLLNALVPIVQGETYAITFHCSVGSMTPAYLNLANATLRKATQLGTNWTYVERALPGSGAFTPTTTRLPAIGFTMDSIEVGGGESISITT